jgi:hypothetical protein
VLLFALAYLLRLQDETYVVRSLDYPACEGRSAESWPAREQFRHVLGERVRKMVEQGEVPVLYDSADDLAPILSSCGKTQIAAPDRYPSTYDIWLIVPVSPLGETAERLAAMREAQVRPEGMATQAVGPERHLPAELVAIDKPAASPIVSSVEVDYVNTRDTSAPHTIEFQRASESVSDGCQTDDPEQITPGTPNSLVSEGFAHARANAPEQPSSAESVFIDQRAPPNQSPVEADEANTPQKPESLLSVRYLPTGSVASPETTSRLRGIGLFAAIFDELSNQLGKEFSTAELMQAAQRLIDISKSEYVPKTYKDVAERAGYYSWDLVRAFGSDNPWRIAGIETSRLDHCDVDEFSSEESQNAKLILEGWNERKWEF